VDVPSVRPGFAMRFVPEPPKSLIQENFKNDGSSTIDSRDKVVIVPKNRRKAQK